MAKQQDLTKITIITILGLSILLFSLFWLKGYKINGHEKITVYFKDVSGLEEGAIVRWSGLRVGVVEDIKPIIQGSKKIQNLLIKKQENINKKIEEETKKLNANPENKDLKESIEILQKQLSVLNEQVGIQSGSAVELSIVITKENVPLGPISRVSVVPSGLIGEYYVEITPVINKRPKFSNFDSVFATTEPLRFERLMKANIESSEAFKEAITKVNQLIQDDDIEMLRSTVKDAREVVQDVNKLIDNAGQLLSTTSSKLEQLATSSNKLSQSVAEVGENINMIIGDQELIGDLKGTASSINTITNEIATLIEEGGLAQDVLEISKTAKDTSSEVSKFITELRQTHNELELPKTISNLNSLAGKLDTLTTELNSVVTDEKFKEDIKVTVEKARETSENLEQISKKFKKRFLLFRLLF